MRTLAVSNGRLFSGSYDCSVRAWDANTLQCLASLEGHRDAVRALVAAEGRVCSGSDDHTVRVWSASSLQLLHVLTGHTDNVRVLVAGPRFVCSGSWDKTVRVWDAARGFACAKARTPPFAPRVSMRSRGIARYRD